MQIGEEMAEFNERLKTLRKGNGLRQIDVADKMNVTKGTISLWERGRVVPDVKTIERLADLFGVSFMYLIGKDPFDEQERSDDEEQLAWLVDNYYQLSIQSRRMIRNVIHGVAEEEILQRQREEKGKNREIMA